MFYFLNENIYVVHMLSYFLRYNLLVLKKIPEKGRLCIFFSTLELFSGEETQMTVSGLLVLTLKGYMVYILLKQKSCNEADTLHL